MVGKVTKVASNRVTIDMERGCLGCEADLRSEAAIAKMVPNQNGAMDGLFCTQQCHDAFWRGESESDISPWDLM
jgi:uncharacterized protein with PIN domain